MTNSTRRGSAPGRARDADQRPGGFKQGHEKRGGRKRGTPNFFSQDYKKAIFEAAYRVGYDGNGKDGLVGYLMWVALRDPESFIGILLIRLLWLQYPESNTQEGPRPTKDELNELVREHIGLTSKNRTRQTDAAEFWSPGDWTGKDFPVSSLMRLAVAYPKGFCKALAATLPRPPTAWQRGLAARRAWERERARASDDASWRKG